MKRLECGCGGLEFVHCIGDPMCYRAECPRDEEPVKLPDGNYIVGKDVVTECTLKEQRLYFQHVDGRWSRPKRPDSVNSIEA